MKIYKDVQKRRKNALSRRSLYFVFCLSLFFLFACQPKTLNERPPAAKSEPLSVLPKVTQIDLSGLNALLKPKDKPLLINFWATWCGPCIEEFPDLVKIGNEYKDKVDLITVSLDELSEINGEVPKFLAEKGSDSPAYLLKTPDADAAIALVSKEWQGALPFTILFNTQGETIYSKQGKFDRDVLTAEIKKLIR